MSVCVAALPSAIAEKCSIRSRSNESGRRSLLDHAASRKMLAASQRWDSSRLRIIGLLLTVQETKHSQTPGEGGRRIIAHRTKHFPVWCSTRTFVRSYGRYPLTKNTILWAAKQSTSAVV